MKVVVLYGSPKKTGNSATLAKKVLEGLNTHDNDITEFWLNDMTIKSCQACQACHKTNKCVISDDMQGVYPAIEAANVVVFASPIYWWHLSSQMKLCLDRLTAMLTPQDKLKALLGKKVVALITFSYEHCAQAAIDMFQEWVTWINVDLSLLPYCSRTEGHASDNSIAMQKAFDIGASL